MKYLLASSIHLFVAAHIITDVVNSAPSFQMERKLNDATISFEAEVSKGPPQDDVKLASTLALNGTIIDQQASSAVGTMFATCTVVDIVEPPNPRTDYFCRHFLSFFRTGGPTGFAQVTTSGTITIGEGKGGSLIVTGTSGDFSDSKGGVLEIKHITATEPMKVEGSLSLN